MPETTATTAPPRHQSGGLAVALAKLNLDALTVADAVADVANTAGANVTAAIRADLKEFRAETETRFAQVNVRFTEVTSRVDGVAGSIQALQKELGSSLQSLQRENATICWMIVVGFTLLSIFLALSTFLRA